MVRPMLASAEPSARLKLVRRRFARAARKAAHVSLDAPHDYIPWHIPWPRTEGSGIVEYQPVHSLIDALSKLA